MMSKIVDAVNLSTMLSGNIKLTNEECVYRAYHGAVGWSAVCDCGIS